MVEVGEESQPSEVPVPEVTEPEEEVILWVEDDWEEEEWDYQTEETNEEKIAKYAAEE